MINGKKRMNLQDNGENYGFIKRMTQDDVKKLMRPTEWETFIQYTYSYGQQKKKMFSYNHETEQHVNLALCLLNRNGDTCL